MLFDCIKLIESKSDVMFYAKGFSLIELMVVLVIVGILVAISLPLYQIYLAKTQLATALSEINKARGQYELLYQGGTSVGELTLDNIGLINSHYCNYLMNPPNSLGEASPALECQLKNVSGFLEGETLELNRLNNGSWECTISSGIPDFYKPVTCE